MCTGAKLAHTFIIKELDRLVGNFIASIEAVSYGRLFYRQYERDKISSTEQV